MKKTVLITVLCFLGAIAISAQSSISLNYLYLGGKNKHASTGVVGTDIGVSKGLVDNGIGIQGKIRLKGRFYIMPDLGYFFEESEKITKSSRPLYYQESKVQYYAANVNFAYAILPKESMSIFLIAGAGYFHESAWLHVFFEGYGSSSQPPYSYELGPNRQPFDISGKVNYASIISNIGFNMEFHVSQNIFVNAGMKYMLDINDTKYSGFPHINIGIGYSF